MGCVHTHQGILTIEACDNPSHGWNIAEKTRKNNQNVRKTKVVNQMLAPRLEHDKFGHNGLKIFCRKACWRSYDSANTSRWNSEIKPFVVWWIAQKKEDTCMLKAIKICMLLWNV